MNSYPCPSSNRPNGCPPLSDTESEGESEGKSEGVTELILPEGGSIQDDYDERSCFFVDRSDVYGTRIESIARLRTTADDLQRRIEDFHAEKQRVHDEIREKKQQLIDAIMKVVEYEISIQEVEGALADKLHHFQARMIELETKRMEIFLTSGDGKVRDLLEREISEVKEEFTSRSINDGMKRDGITQEAQIFAASLGDIIKEYRSYYDELIAQVERDEPHETVQELQNEVNFNMTQLHRLISRPAKFCRDKNGERFYKNAGGEKIFKVDSHSSEYKLNDVGAHEMVKDGLELFEDAHGEFYVDNKSRKLYTKYFFEDENGRFYIDVHGDRKYKTDPEASEYMLLNGNWKKIKDGTYPTDERGLRIKPKENEIEIKRENFDGSNESALESDKESKTEKNLDDDVEYIKKAVGPAIRKGLAAVALHQPADPINYFANFLLHYRYNQNMFEKRENELKYFVELREKMKEDDKSEE